jgi:type I restriction enzyme, S subunit
MKNGWQEIELNNVIEFANGKSVKPGGEGKYPVYGANGLIGGSDKFTNKNAIIIGRVGAYCGAIAYCSTEFWASDNTIVASPKDTNLDVIFCSYLLRTLDLRKYAGGAAQPLVTQNVLGRVRTRIPSIIIQRNIASILSAYDDFIENNTRRIKILEEMARLIYREWFVEFKAPGIKLRKATPEEKKVIGKDVFPEDWEIVELSKLYKTSSGSTPSRGRDEYFKNGVIQWVKTKELRDSFIFDTEEKISEQGFNNSSTKLFPQHTVIMAMYGATIGKLGILSKPATTNQACCAFTPLNEAYSYPYLYLYLYLNRHKIISLGSGAAQQNVSQDVIKDFQITKPDDATFKRFNENVVKMFEWIEVLQEKNQNLRQTRDLLLPKLISGEVEV